MFWFQFAIVLLCIFIGARIGGVGTSMCYRTARRREEAIHHCLAEYRHVYPSLGHAEDLHGESFEDV